MRAQEKLSRCHSFEQACADSGIKHLPKKPRHPWTNDKVERINHTIKDAIVWGF
jgi:transposase InsO family protein